MKIILEIFLIVALLIELAIFSIEEIKDKIRYKDLLNNKFC